MLDRVERERITMMLIAGALLLSLAFGHATAPPEPAPPPPPMITDEPARGDAMGITPVGHHHCGGEISDAASKGIIIIPPMRGRMDVDDHLWGALAPHRRHRLMRAAACILWRSGVPPPGEELVAYGTTSGRRLAVLSGMRKEGR